MSRKLVLWGYVVELVAAALILVCLSLWLSADLVVYFVRIASIDIATLFGAVMFAATLAFLWSFYAKVDTEFYRWLEEKGAFTVYQNAIIYAVGVSFTTIAALVLAKYIEGRIVGLIACYFLLLAIINLYSLVCNVAGIMRLNAKFNSIKRDT